MAVLPIKGIRLQIVRRSRARTVLALVLASAEGDPPAEEAPPAEEDLEARVGVEAAVAPVGLGDRAAPERGVRAGAR